MDRPGWNASLQEDEPRMDDSMFPEWEKPLIRSAIKYFLQEQQRQELQRARRNKPQQSPGVLTPTHTPPPVPTDHQPSYPGHKRKAADDEGPSSKSSKNSFAGSTPNFASSASNFASSAPHFASSTTNFASSTQHFARERQESSYGRGGPFPLSGEVTLGGTLYPVQNQKFQNDSLVRRGLEAANDSTQQGMNVKLLSIRPASGLTDPALQALSRETADQAISGTDPKIQQQKQLMDQLMQTKMLGMGPGQFPGGMGVIPPYPGVLPGMGGFAGMYQPTMYSGPLQDPMFQGMYSTNPQRLPAHPWPPQSHLLASAPQSLDLTGPDTRRLSSTSTLQPDRSVLPEQTSPLNLEYTDRRKQKTSATITAATSSKGGQETTSYGQHILKSKEEKASCAENRPYKPDTPDSLGNGAEGSPARLGVSGPSPPSKAGAGEDSQPGSSQLSAQWPQSSKSQNHVDGFIMVHRDQETKNINLNPSTSSNQFSPTVPANQLSGGRYGAEWEERKDEPDPQLHLSPDPNSTPASKNTADTPVTPVNRDFDLLESSPVSQENVTYVPCLLTPPPPPPTGPLQGAPFTQPAGPMIMPGSESCTGQLRNEDTGKRERGRGRGRGKGRGRGRPHNVEPKVPNETNPMTAWQNSGAASWPNHFPPPLPNGPHGAWPAASQSQPLMYHSPFFPGSSVLDLARFNSEDFPGQHHIWGNPYVRNFFMPNSNRPPRF